MVFCSNYKEAQKLVTEDYQKSVAEAVAEGILSYIKENRIAEEKQFFFRTNNDIIKFMETIIRKIDKNQINQDVIEEAGNVLKQGGLVAFPTETVYGLGADALKEEAAKKTYAAKGRPSDNPLIVHIADYEDLKKVAVNIPPETDALAAHFWPGPLTMIFEKK